MANTSGSHVTTTCRPATRRISASPAAASGQWCTVSTASAASNAPSPNGNAPATPRTTAAAPGARCPIIVSDGSTATTARSAGSYDPAPAPTFTTVRASPSARRITAAHRGSGRRFRAYPTPISSYSAIVDRVSPAPASRATDKKWRPRRPPAIPIPYNL